MPRHARPLLALRISAHARGRAAEWWSREKLRETKPAAHRRGACYELGRLPKERREVAKGGVLIVGDEYLIKKLPGMGGGRWQVWICAVRLSRKQGLCAPRGRDEQGGTEREAEQGQASGINGSGVGLLPSPGSRCRHGS